MGVTFLEYQNEYRLSFIYKDLINTKDPVHIILERHGFTNYKPVIDDEQVMDVIRDRDAKLAQTGGQVPIEEFEYKVRRLINDYVRPPKNEYKLDRALWWMDRFRSELRTEVCIRNQHDLFKAYEVENIIQCAAMSAVASKERKESRWGLWHMRSDYPVKDDAQWLKHIVLTQGDSLEDIRVSYVPVIKMEETA